MPGAHICDMGKDVLGENVVELSRCVIRICHELDYIKLQVVSRQLMRSATAVGASVAEAGEAESANDFIHKVKIALKEAKETKYWFDVIDGKVPIPERAAEVLTTVQKIIAKSIHTATRNLNEKRKTDG